MLAHVLERAKAIRGIDEVILAVPRTDKELEQFEPLGTSMGSPIDVLDRVVLACTPPDESWTPEPDAVIRLTGDCPLVSPHLAEHALSVFQEQGADYVSTTRPYPDRQFPDGLDVEVVSWRALETAHEEATDPADLEHVTSFIWREAILEERSRFRMVALESEEQWREVLRGLKLSVDTQEDLERVRVIYRYLGPGDFSLAATRRAIKEARRHGDL